MYEFICTYELVRTNSYISVQLYFCPFVKNSGFWLGFEVPEFAHHWSPSKHKALISRRLYFQTVNIHSAQGQCTHLPMTSYFNKFKYKSNKIRYEYVSGFVLLFETTWSWLWRGECHGRCQRCSQRTWFKCCLRVWQKRGSQISLSLGAQEIGFIQVMARCKW